MRQDLADLTASCIRCGFCIEACPTYQEKGREDENPRGRIYLARLANEGKLPWAETVDAFDTCLGCRACQSVCPSGVKFGHILEIARSETEDSEPKIGIQMLLKTVTSPALFRAAVTLGRVAGGKLPKFLATRLSSETPQAALPTPQAAGAWPPMDVPQPIGGKGQVDLLRGCAMDVLFTRVHEATERLILRTGYAPNWVSGCCGALHAHAGFLGTGFKLAKSLATDRALVVNSAGCGSWLKERRAGVQDITEFLKSVGFDHALRYSKGLNAKVAYHDACHLAHGQGIRTQPRELLQAIPGVQLVDLSNSDTCCGSAGIYNLTQPAIARRMLERKWKSILDSGAEIVVSGNPGCHSWIEQMSRENGSQIHVLHTAELLESAFSGLPAPD